MAGFLKIFVPVAALLIIGVLAYGMSMDTVWNVQRSVLIQANVDVVHPLVERPRSWERWAAREMSQVERVTMAYSGPEAGPGASYSWDSPGSNGVMTIVRSDPQGGIQYEMSLEDDRSQATGSIRYNPGSKGLKVTWTDTGDIGMKPFGGFMVGWMEASLAGHFENSLELLKQEAEADQKALEAG